jgi:hypothetical protein
MESPQGPLWPGKLCGVSLDISLSHTEKESWIGLIRGGRIGVDAMKLQPFPGIEDVARNYFAPAAIAQIEKAADTFRAFATEWTMLEAQIKCLKLNLIEWSPARDKAMAGCTYHSQERFDDVLVSVATAPVAGSSPAPGLIHFESVPAMSLP